VVWSFELTEFRMMFFDGLHLGADDLWCIRRRRGGDAEAKRNPHNGRAAGPVRVVGCGSMVTSVALFFNVPVRTTLRGYRKVGCYGCKAKAQARELSRWRSRAGRLTGGEPNGRIERPASTALLTAAPRDRPGWR